MKAEAPKPAPTGFERLSDDWPRWIKVGVQYRGRAEQTDGLAAVKGRDDAYYLNRVRLDSTFIVKPWASVFTQVQDAQTFGNALAAPPISMTNTFDLRQAYRDVQQPPASAREPEHRRTRPPASAGPTGLSLRVGRQELAFGEQRLIGYADWGNTSRTFDAAQVTVSAPRGKVDVFVASVVKIEPGRFDRHKTDERLLGASATITAKAMKGTIEPYLFVKDSDAVVGELGGAAEAGRVYATGVRIVGALPSRIDFSVEVVVERGAVASDDLAAWAGHYNAGWLVSPSRIKPRLFAELNEASGDSDPTDGHRGTFDQLYPTNHGKYGLVDQMGWRNMRDAVLGFEISPTPKFKVTSAMHRMFLATTSDGLYNAAGVRTTLNPKASSRDVGTELDIATSYAVSRELTLSAGLGHLTAGNFLVESLQAASLWVPYVMWNVRF